MRKFAAGAALLALGWAAQFSGLILDEADGRGLSAELWINARQVPIAADGRYQAEIDTRQPNHYWLKTKNDVYLFVTNRVQLNLQLAAAEHWPGRQNRTWADLDITLWDAGQLVEKADVTIYAVLAEVNKINR
ncbi:hypothetical protein NO2_0770, partial [Candidatus Termititenax persephonae]